MAQRRKLNDKERLDWLQLIRTSHIGPVNFHRLLAKFKDADAALKALPEISRRAGRKTPFKPLSRSALNEELRAADQHGAKLIAACEPDYPQALRNIADHPPLVFVRGHIGLFEKPAVAIIGARNASGVGRKIARTLATDLGAAGYAVVSGLARGIDGAAHAASLSKGSIAVVAGGVDVVYPPEHADLTERLAHEGAVISERPMGLKPVSRDFPRRNRLISGLSRGVVVVEAAAKSGTLLTANFALEQGREVFAVPGSPLDPRCQGANRLIRDGAVLVENAQDIIDALAAQTSAVEDKERDLFYWAQPDIDETRHAVCIAAVRERVLEILSYTPLHLDIILREANAPPGLVADALLELVLTGEAAEHNGGCFSLAAID